MIIIVKQFFWPIRPMYDSTASLVSSAVNARTNDNSKYIYSTYWPANPFSLSVSVWQLFIYHRKINSFCLPFSNVCKQTSAPLARTSEDSSQHNIFFSASPNYPVNFPVYEHCSILTFLILTIIIVALFHTVHYTHDSLQHLIAKLLFFFVCHIQYASELPPLLDSFLSLPCNNFCFENSQTQHIVFLIPEALMQPGKKKQHSSLVTHFIIKTIGEEW